MLRVTCRGGNNTKLRGDKNCIALEVELKQKSPVRISAMGFLRDIHRRSKKILLIDSPHTQILIAAFVPSFLPPIRGPNSVDKMVNSMIYHN